MKLAKGEDDSPALSTMGIIGESINYSLSPLIHNPAAKSLGIKAEYRIFSMSEREVAPFISNQWQQGAIGFNVTRPYKKLVARLSNNRKLSAVNTLYRGKGHWQSASTDGEGFSAALARAGRPLDSFGRIVILGSGGASVSILEYLSSIRYSGVVMVAARRNISLIDLEHLGPLSPVLVELSAKTLEKIAKNQRDCLVVQATSAPMHGDDLAWLVPALKDFEGAFFDMVYGHSSAPLEFCRSLSLTAMDGIPMLIEQARAAQILWWGQCEDYDSIEQRLNKSFADNR